MSTQSVNITPSDVYGTHAVKVSGTNMHDKSISTADITAPEPTPQSIPHESGPFEAAVFPANTPAAAEDRTAHTLKPVAGSSSPDRINAAVTITGRLSGKARKCS